MLMLSSFMDRELHLFLDDVTHWIAHEVPALLSGVLLPIGGWWFAGRMQAATVRLMQKQTKIDPTLRGLVSSLVHYGILIFVIVAALGQLGIQTTSILAALGAAGLAIGLALQGTLSNIAAGLMLIWLRPFRVGDYVETGSFAGQCMKSAYSRPNSTLTTASFSSCRTRNCGTGELSIIRG